MADMSEILKRIKQRQTQEKAAVVPQPPILPRPEKKEAVLSPLALEKKEERPRLEIRPAIKILNTRRQAEKTDQSYQDAVVLIAEIMNKELKFDSLNIKELLACLNLFIEQLKTEDAVLLELAASIANQEKDSARHAVNVCIFCLKIGLSLKYERQKVEDLGICALVHNIVMKEHKEIFSPHTSQMFRRYNKRGSLIQSEMLEGLAQVCQEVIQASSRQRLNYPQQGLSEEEISELAKVVCLACVYEAMIHARIYLGEYLSFEKIKTLIKDKDGLLKRSLKILIKAVGLYAVGSLVQLSTQEEARVIKINQGMPFRPAVEVICDSSGNKFEETRQLDLLHHPTIYIKKAIPQK